MKTLITILTFLVVTGGCGSKKIATPKSEISLRETQENPEESNYIELPNRPNGVLNTAYPEHHLVTIYRARFNKKYKRLVMGNNDFRTQYRGYYEENKSDPWNSHLMPGFEIVYGYGLVNISHYDLNTQELKDFFDSNALIKNVYYPTEESDSLAGKPIVRDHYFVSVYDQDTNADSLINQKDLRHFYHFDLSASEKTPVLPMDHSAISSEYDAVNDAMFIYARHDKNQNGQSDFDEPVHVFWIDLKNPKVSKQIR